MPTTSAAYRQNTRQTYIASSRREGGISHLWHLQHLANIRLGPHAGIEDEPQVNFGETKHEVHEAMCARADDAARRHMIKVQREEDVLVKDNRALLQHLIDNTDDAQRRARNMCHFPDEEELRKFYKARDQLYFKDKVRRQNARGIDRKNKVLLGHLIECKPGVKTAKSLNDWYNQTHKKRLKQLSRFKKDEPYAGADVLQRECGVRKNNKGNSTAADSVRHPLIARQPYPPLPVGEMMSTAPTALLPALRMTTYGGYPVGAEATAAIETEKKESGGERRKEERPAWQSIAATDIPLMNYAADKLLNAGCHYRVVQPPEEGPCTQLWRHAVRDHRDANRRQIEKDIVASIPRRAHTSNGMHGPSAAQHSTSSTPRRRRRSQMALKAAPEGGGIITTTSSTARLPAKDHPLSHSSSEAPRALGSTSRVSHSNNNDNTDAATPPQADDTPPTVCAPPAARDGDSSSSSSISEVDVSAVTTSETPPLPARFAPMRPSLTEPRGSGNRRRPSVGIVGAWTDDNNNATVSELEHHQQSAAARQPLPSSMMGDTMAHNVNKNARPFPQHKQQQQQHKQQQQPVSNAASHPRRRSSAASCVSTKSHPEMVADAVFDAMMGEWSKASERSGERPYLQL